MDKKLLSYICCPICKGTLLLKEKKLTCTKCKKRYTIRNNIPILFDLDNLPRYITHQIEYFEEENKTRPVYRLAEWQKSYLRRFLENVTMKKNSLVLDIGCGSGYMAIELAKKGATVIANDIIHAQLTKLLHEAKKQKLTKKLFFVCCSAEALPFKNSIADVVIANAILEHLPKEKAAIKELDRVSQKRAQLMISVPNNYWYIWPFLIPINIWHDKRIGHLRRYTKADLIKKMRGFTLANMYYTGHLFKFLVFAFSLIFKTKKLDLLAEKSDEKFSTFSYGATVITAFFKR